jgi:hypothetical protein
VFVKSVKSEFTFDWLVDTFDPRIVVVWRHPLNVVSSWLGREWRGKRSHLAPVQQRFAGTVAWPPASEGPAEIAWTVCATMTILLEAAERHGSALVLNHETTTQSPLDAAASVLAWLGLPWHDAVGDFIVDSNREGDGWALRRVQDEEPERWKQRLGAADARAVLDVVARFADASPVAAAAWASSPAVAS